MTIISTSNTWPEPDIYGGISLDLKIIDGGTSRMDAIIPLLVLDLPLSFCADTALLPLNLMFYAFREDEEEDEEKSPVEEVEQDSNAVTASEAVDK
jgi:uncharacterized protein YceK